MARPTAINDLQVMWAIRDIPSSILEFKHKSLLWGLLSIIGNKESCYYSQPQLAEVLGCSERHIRTLLKDLECKNFIQITHSDKKGRGYANEYKLNYIVICGYLKIRHDLPASEEKPAQFAGIQEKSRHSLPQKPAQFASQDIHRDIHKSREYETHPVNNLKRSKNEQWQEVPENYEPTIEHIAMMDKRRLNVSATLAKFINLNRANGKKYKNLDSAFSYFIESEKEPIVKLEEVRSTAMEYGPGHPRWELLYGKEGISKKNDIISHKPNYKYN